MAEDFKAGTLVLVLEGNMFESIAEIGPKDRHGYICRLWCENCRSWHLNTPMRAELITREATPADLARHKFESSDLDAKQ